MGVIGARIGAALASKLNVDFQQIAHVAPARKEKWLQTHVATQHKKKQRMRGGQKEQERERLLP